MASDRVQLAVRRREEFGSSVSRRLRGNGLVPGVLYGAGGPASAFVVDEHELRRALDHGLNALMDVVVDGDQPRHAVVKDYQVHPVRSRLLHIDLQEVRLDRPIQATVVLETIGQAQGVVRGGLLNVAVRELLVEGLPALIPERIEVDVTEMLVGDVRTIGDLEPPEGVTIIGDPELPVVLVAATRVARTDDELEGEEGAEGEGDAPVGDGGAGGAGDAAADASDGDSE